MNFQEIRSKYPQYDDLSDADLAKGLHQKYYSDLDFNDFAQRVGYNNESSRQDQSLVGSEGFGRAEPVQQPWYEQAADAVQSGYQRGKKYIAQNIGDMLDTTDEEKMRTAVRVTDLERKAQQYDPGMEMQQKIQQIDQSKDIGEFMQRVWDNPEAVGVVTLQSIGMYAPVMAVTTGVGAATGGLATSFAMRATSGLGSFATEYAATVDQTIQEAGYDSTDPLSWYRALQDKALMDKARERGKNRGLAVGIFDAITAGLAGKILAGAKPKFTSIAGRGLAETAVQAGGGMAGDAAAQIADKGKIDSIGSIGLEGIAGVPISIPEQIVGYRAAKEQALQRIDPQVKPAEENKNAINDALNVKQQAEAEAQAAQQAQDYGLDQRQADEYNRLDAENRVLETAANVSDRINNDPSVTAQFAQPGIEAAPIDTSSGEIIGQHDAGFIQDMLDNRQSDATALPDEQYHPEQDTFGRRALELAQAAEEVEPGAGETILERAAIQGLGNHDVINELEGFIRERTAFPNRTRPATTAQTQSQRPETAVDVLPTQKTEPAATEQPTEAVTPPARAASVAVAPITTQPDLQGSATPEAHTEKRFKTKAAANLYKKKYGLGNTYLPVSDQKAGWRLHKPANAPDVDATTSASSENEPTQAGQPIAEPLKPTAQKAQQPPLSASPAPTTQVSGQDQNTDQRAVATFKPTHVTSDDVPVVAAPDEPAGTWIDQQGDIIEDQYASPIGDATASTQARQQEAALPAQPDQPQSSGIAAQPAQKQNSEGATDTVNSPQPAPIDAPQNNATAELLAGYYETPKGDLHIDGDVAQIRTALAEQGFKFKGAVRKQKGQPVGIKISNARHKNDLTGQLSTVKAALLAGERKTPQTVIDKKTGDAIAPTGNRKGDTETYLFPNGEIQSRSDSEITNRKAEANQTETKPEATETTTQAKEIKSKSNEKQSQTEETPAKAQTAEKAERAENQPSDRKALHHTIPERLGATRTPPPDHANGAKRFIPLDQITLKTETESGEKISVPAQAWLSDIDKRLEQINQLRGCMK